VSAPTTRSVLQALSKARLLELARTFAVAVPPTGTKDAHADALVDAGSVRFPDLLAALGRDELKAACRTHGLDDSGRARPLLAARLLEAHGAAESVPPKPLFSANTPPRYAPRPGDIVRVRHRQWLVEAVVAPPAEELFSRATDVSDPRSCNEGLELKEKHLSTISIEAIDKNTWTNGCEAVG